MISTSVNESIVADVEMVKECADETLRDMYINDLITEYGSRGVHEFIRLSGELMKNRIRMKLNVHPKAWAFTLKYAEDIVNLRRTEAYERLHNGMLDK
ncbi:hypothetical protein VWJ57_03485 [Escherichia coli O157]|nr:hypothetical protein [Escherichia coli]MED6826530.1 hypothetical protein [Escherichia coli O157]HAN3822023.1 hypothetical protein [Escherichia coli]HAN4697477.1 hypothetical protein [Escherichia coli]HBN4943349.1 hypothetical protein [Escherichia coli]